MYKIERVGQGPLPLRDSAPRAKPPRPSPERQDSASKGPPALQSLPGPPSEAGRTHGHLHSQSTVPRPLADSGLQLDSQLNLPQHHRAAPALEHPRLPRLTTGSFYPFERPIPGRYKVNQSPCVWSSGFQKKRNTGGLPSRVRPIVEQIHQEGGSITIL